MKIVEAPFDSHCEIRELDEVKILNPKIPNSRPVKEEPVKRKSPRLIEGNDKISADRVNGDGEDEEKEVEFLNVKKIAGYKEKSVSFTITSGSPWNDAIRTWCMTMIIFTNSFLLRGIFLVFEW